MVSATGLIVRRGHELDACCACSTRTEPGDGLDLHCRIPDERFHFAGKCFSPVGRCAGPCAACHAVEPAAEFVADVFDRRSFEAGARCSSIDGAAPNRRSPRSSGGSPGARILDQVVEQRATDAAALRRGIDINRILNAER